MSTACFVTIAKNEHFSQSQFVANITINICVEVMRQIAKHKKIKNHKNEKAINYKFGIQQRFINVQLTCILCTTKI